MAARCLLRERETRERIQQATRDHQGRHVRASGE
jgi:hypothetical protein